MRNNMNIYFSDFFNVSTDLVEKYGAFNISLINDLPLFIDPFLLFGSKNYEYQKLHTDILKYLKFLKNKAEDGTNNTARIKSWYLFPEVKQNWFGYSKIGNSGSGLGMKFGRAFSSSISVVFEDIGKEKVTQSSHLEKAGLFEIGIGRDNISDFTTNLIKEFLLEYTEAFALKYLKEDQTKKCYVEKVFFDYVLERWMPKEYTLPFIFDDFVILTPRDILTKDDNWINSNDLRGNFTRICNSIPNDQLRNEIFNYFHKMLPPKKKNKQNTQKEISLAIHDTIRKYPEIIKYYIKYKEDDKNKAKYISAKKVKAVEEIFIKEVQSVVEVLLRETKFYDIEPDNSYDQSMKRLKYLKDVIENKDGYKLFYVDGAPIKREEDLQIIYRLTWYATDFDINREPNNGRGPVDYAVSKGASDKTIIEFKLASNAKLRQNLAHQVRIYEKANDTKNSIKAILYFDNSELDRVLKILRDLRLDKAENIILIDASKKVSASNVK